MGGETIQLIRALRYPSNRLAMLGNAFPPSRPFHVIAP